MSWPRAVQLGNGRPAATLARREAQRVARGAVAERQHQLMGTLKGAARGRSPIPCSMKKDINWCSPAGSAPTKLAPRAGRQAACQHLKGAMTVKRRRRRPDGCGPTRIPMTTGDLRTATVGAMGGKGMWRMLMKYPTPANCGGSSKSMPRQSAIWKGEEVMGPRLTRCARRGTPRRRAGGGPRPQLPCRSAWTGRRRSSARPRRRSPEPALNWTVSTRRRIVGEVNSWEGFVRQRVGTSGASNNSTTFTTRRPREPQGVAGGAE